MKTCTAAQNRQKITNFEVQGRSRSLMSIPSHPESSSEVHCLSWLAACLYLFAIVFTLDEPIQVK